MKTGMLWFDNSKDDLLTKINRAADYYQQKYGQRPTECYVHPVMMSSTILATDINIHTSRQVLPNHLWMGCEKKL